jgi:hypothetical protein
MRHDRGLRAAYGMGKNADILNHACAEKDHAARPASSTRRPRRLHHDRLH